MVTIVQNGNPILRKQAREVPISDIVSPKIQKIMSDMKTVLATQDDGVALAAPQIGKSLRIFIVSGAMLKLASKNYKGDESFMIFINPEILKLSKERQKVEEGCLSVRWKYGKIERAKKASIRAYDENGKLFERGASGLLAQVFQHEIDHLKGILFIDNAYDIKDIPREEQTKGRLETV
ncbi:MAG TPA: peptide deformylase [Candidatus Paceibacterota bacterium]